MIYPLSLSNWSVEIFINIFTFPLCFINKDNLIIFVPIIIYVYSRSDTVFSIWKVVRQTVMYFIRKFNKKGGNDLKVDPFFYRVGL